MGAINNFLPEGARDIISEDCYKKEEIRKSLEENLENWGYEQIITPTLEYYDTFNSHPEAFKQEEMYKFFDNKGKILVLRPDMTIPMARVVSTKLKDYKRPIRVRYTSNVYRVNEAFGGKPNEITHCGAELIGRETLEGDLEIIYLSINLLKALDLKEFKIELGHMGIISGIFEELNLEDEVKEKISFLIEKKRLGELQGLLNKLNISKEIKSFLEKLPWLFGNVEVLDSISELEIYEKIKEPILYLKALAEGIKKLELQEYVSLDLGIIPKINYYTGVIIRGYVQGVGNYVLQGGRYDKLINSFGIDNGAIGFAINIDSLIEVYKSSKKEKITKIIYSKKDFIEALAKGNELTSKGYKVNLIEKKDTNAEIESDENTILI
ncbi:ATP phosphoribosyltransferase regulatory subunit [Clostridium sp. 'White wine YQ']|uniref:ATP phosphoribosyltransferase regulatory subunit n=1 Tax=Clostridium sp. 'White wine YQ' TaxID=3027474 RepID=UPI0023655037|nr:ATP phosphoribosyltransferase regulatory subunit [Clostridium sp. 'White wine YQ']MDD7792957.1 ATP phosphoribosyltransferase regulatory subunit [Clostridium sp. 'White wine YQ']